jgi:hypothetical protein
MGSKQGRATSIVGAGDGSPKQEKQPPEGVFDEKPEIFRRLTMR